MANRIGLAMLAAFGASALAFAALADEEKVELDKVPAPVLKAFKAKFPDAKIKAAIKETEDGKTVYEIESTRKDLTVDAILTAEGKFVEIEEQVAAEDLPEAVTKALAAKYPNSSTGKVEAVTKGDGPTTYEVALSVEVVLTAKGKVVGAEEAEEDAAAAKAKKKAKKAKKKKAKE